MDQKPRTWPNLIGKNGKDAVEQIKQESGFTNVHTVVPNSIVTMDYRTDRVRVHVDDQGKVSLPPTVG